MSIITTPALPSIEGLPNGHAERHPNGIISRMVTRWFNGSIEDHYCRPDGTWSRLVVRSPNGRICDHYYNPDRTKAVTIRYFP